MLGSDENLIQEVRARFEHVETCPIQGERIFFENGGGALTLKSVVETSTRMSAIPDNQGRDNPASQELVRIISKARADAKLFLNATSGQIITGESGTELLFRLISAASLACSKRWQCDRQRLGTPGITQRVCQRGQKSQGWPT